MQRTLITLPRLDVTGGVANYYAVLALDREAGIEYFAVTTSDRRPLWRVLRLMRVFLLAPWRMLRVHTTVVNPSLNRNSFWRDALIVALARLLTRRVIVFWRGWEWAYFEVVAGSALHRAVFRHTFARADVTLYLATAFHDAVRDRLGGESGKVRFETTVAEDVESEPEPSRPASRRRCILFMSRMDERKGIYVVLGVYGKLRAAGVNVRLVMAGSGDALEAAKDYACRHALQDISFPGYAREAKKHGLYRQADVFFFPTRYGEGMPNCVLEALAHGLPVVSTYNAGIPDVVTDGVNGYLFEQSSGVDAYLPVMRRLLEDDELRERMGQAARASSGRFRRAAVRARMLRLLNPGLESEENTVG